MTTATGHGFGAAAIGDRLARARDSVEVAVFDHRAAVAWLLPLLALSAVVSFVGFAGAPQRSAVEGAPMALVWSALTGGAMPAVPWADQPPVGWLQLAGYVGLTDGFARWDAAVFAGREALVVAALVSVVLVWMLSRRLGLRRPAAAAAGLVFACSPLALHLHRTVTLDDVATPWLLLAFVLALARSRFALAFAGSAVAFGVAVLSRETFVVALPVLLWMMARGPARRSRAALPVASVLVVLLLGGYPFVAAALGQQGALDTGPGLLSGIADRFVALDAGGSILDAGSRAAVAAASWWALDPVLVVLGLVAAALAMPVHALRPIGVLVLGVAALLLVPGAAVTESSVVLLLPFAAVLAAGVPDTAVLMLQRRVRRWRPLAVATVAIAGAAVVALVPLWTLQLRGLLVDDRDAPVRAAQGWLTDNAPRDTVLVVDPSMWVDLRRAGWDDDALAWFQRLDAAPVTAPEGDPIGWRDARYLVSTPSMRAAAGDEPVLEQAIAQSLPVAAFGDGAGRIEVRRLVPQGIAQATVELEAAAEQRLTLGRQLVRNPDLAFSDIARRQLLAGQVDARIAIALAAQAPDARLEIAAFPRVPGEPGELRRTISLASIDGAPAVDRRKPSAAALAFVDILQGEYAPSATVAGDSGLRLLITFPIEVPTETVP